MQFWKDSISLSKFRLSVVSKTFRRYNSGVTAFITRFTISFNFLPQSVSANFYKTTCPSGMPLQLLLWFPNPCGKQLFHCLTLYAAPFWSPFVCCFNGCFVCIMLNKICFIPITTKRSFTLSTCVCRTFKSWRNSKSSSSSKLIFSMAATFFSSVTLTYNNNLSMSFLKFILIASYLKFWKIAATGNCFWLINNVSFFSSCL